MRCPWLAPLAHPKPIEKSSDSEIHNLSIEAISGSNDVVAGTYNVPWHFITPEYPPTHGGVADHSAMLAAAIADRGIQATVWYPVAAALSATPPDSTGKQVRLQPLPFGFSPHGLVELSRRLGTPSAERVICIHYVPHGYGYKAMNVPFAMWVYWRSWRGDDIRILFHEVIFPWVRSPLRQNLLAAVTRVMAFLLVRAARRCYVTIPGWRPYLWAVGAKKNSKIPVVPVPSMLPVHYTEGSRGELRATLVPDTHSILIGHFGTYGHYVTRYLEPIVSKLLQARTDVRLLFLGHGGVEWLANYRQRFAIASDRLMATGALAPLQVAEHLAVCDMMIQPYPDGASFRRTSLMASLQQGKPIVTSTGMLSEPVWNEGAVATASVGDVDGFVAQVCKLVEGRVCREQLSLAAAELYQSQFAIEHTVDTLLADL